MPRETLLMVSLVALTLFHAAVAPTRRRTFDLARGPEPCVARGPEPRGARAGGRHLHRGRDPEPLRRHAPVLPVGGLEPGA